MPFTQDRAIALVRAARDMERAFTKLAGLIQTESAIHADNAALQSLAGLARDITPFLAEPAATLTVLEREQTHFEKVFRRNAKNAERQRLRRGPNKPAKPGIFDLPDAKPPSVIKEPANWQDAGSLPAADGESLDLAMDLFTSKRVSFTKPEESDDAE